MGQLGELEDYLLGTFLGCLPMVSSTRWLPTTSPPVC